MATTLGNTTTNTAIAPGTNAIHVTKFTLAAPLTVVRGAVLWTNANANAKSRMVIYDDDGAGGIPGTLMGVSDERIGMLAGSVWIPYRFSTPVVLAAGDWCVGIHTDTNISLRADNTAGTSYNATDTYSDGSPAAFPAPTTTTRRLGCYVSDSDPVDIAKANSYSVLGVNSGVSVAKAVSYSVVTDMPSGVTVAKALSYSVLQEAGGVATSRPQIIIVRN